VVAVIAIVAIRRGGCAIAGLTLDAFVDFLAMYTDFARRFHAQTHLITFHPKHRDIDIIANNDGFTDSPGQNKHSCLPPPVLVISILP